MGFDDLAGEGEAYSGAGFFGGVERDEEVFGIGEAWAVVFDCYGDEVGVFSGAEGDGGAFDSVRPLARTSSAQDDVPFAYVPRFAANFAQ